jgi:hypothetical protein
MMPTAHRVPLQVALFVAFCCYVAAMHEDIHRTALRTVHEDVHIYLHVNIYVCW